jgi:hypothetical protein
MIRCFYALLSIPSASKDDSISSSAAKKVDNEDESREGTSYRIPVSSSSSSSELETEHKDLNFPRELIRISRKYRYDTDLLLLSIVYLLLWVRQIFHPRAR